MNFKTVGLLCGVASIVVFMAGDATAQGRKGGRGHANYRVAAEMTVTGTVESVKPGRQQGMHVLLKTSEATLELALGPAWYQTEKKFELATGDQIVVVGATAAMGGRDVLLVREIKKGGATMAFRDTNGFPLWARRGRQ